MTYNVPDDWGNYYSTCSLCGSRYHDSEGGCHCIDESCQCEGNWFERIEDEIICTKCGTGPWQESQTITTKHIARKDHKHGTIKTGETYRKMVIFGYYPNGKRTREIITQRTCD